MTKRERIKAAMVWLWRLAGGLLPERAQRAVEKAWAKPWARRAIVTGVIVAGGALASWLGGLV